MSDRYKILALRAELDQIQDERNEANPERCVDAAEEIMRKDGIDFHKRFLLETIHDTNWITETKRRIKEGRFTPEDLRGDSDVRPFTAAEDDAHAMGWIDKHPEKVLVMILKKCRNKPKIDDLKDDDLWYRCEDEEGRAYEFIITPEDLRGDSDKS